MTNVGIFNLSQFMCKNRYGSPIAIWLTMPLLTSFWSALNRVLIKLVKTAFGLLANTLVNSL